MYMVPNQLSVRVRLAAHAHELVVCVMNAGRFHVFTEKKNMLAAQEKCIFVRILHNALLDLRLLPTQIYL